MATGSGKTGKPSISDIRNLDVRSISMAVSNIRQRIEAIEGALGVTTDTAQEAATTSGLQLKELLNEISALDSRVTILEKTASTDIVAYTAGETIASGQGVVGISASTIGVADPSDPTRMFGLIGIATNGGSVGASILVQRRGVFTIPGASGFFVGRAAYLDNSGYVTQTPDYEATALPIGVAVSSSQIFINPDYPSILQQTFSSGFSDAFEKYLPITLGGLLPLLTEIDPVCIQAACSDETTSLTTGIKLVFRVPYNFTLTNVRASLTTAQSLTVPTGTTDVLLSAEGASSRAACSSWRRCAKRSAD